MSFGSRLSAVAASLTSLTIVLGIPGVTNALSLADLATPGASFSAGNGIRYSNFIVKIQGRGLSHDLRDYEVVPAAEGFLLLGDVSGRRKGGRINLRYGVTGSRLFRAGVAIDAGQASHGKLAVTERLFDVDRIDMLQAWTRNGKTSDFATFDALLALQVREKITIKGDYSLARSGGAITHSFHANSPTPEPTTGLMLAAGLAALAATRHSRWCTRRSR
jgi:hypothetical protein